MRGVRQPLALIRVVVGGSPILLWLKVDVDKMDVEQHNKWEEISTKDFTAHSLEFLTSGNCLKLESSSGSEVAFLSNNIPKV